MKNKLFLSKEKFEKYVNATIVVLLFVLLIILLAQYFINMDGAVFKIRHVVLVLSCFILAMLVIVSSYATTTIKVKLTLFVLDFIMLLIVCFCSGSSYLYILFCIILTQLYMSVSKLKIKLILGAIGCMLYIAAFVTGWITFTGGTVIDADVAQIIGDILLGLLVIAVHFICINFTISFIDTNERLIVALSNEEESRAQLERAHEQLKEVALLEQRNRIAKDIHDNAGHSMTAIIMQTEAAKLLIDSQPSEAKPLIISANLQAKIALNQMRDSVHLLAGRGTAITLKDEIGEIFAQTMDGTGIKVMSEIDDVEVDDNIRRFICNTVKELLTNGMRHGGATAFYVRLKCVNSSIYLLVSDNGRGVVGEFIEGFGLKSLREKLIELGGMVTYSFENLEGFEVNIEIPIKEEK